MKNPIIDSLSSPDFKSLAKEYPDTIGCFFNPTTNKYDFGYGPEADCRLVEALALKTFGIRLKLDPNYLCPRLLNRYLYVQWIRGLINETREMNEILALYYSSDDKVVDIYKESDTCPPTILDIGVGSSCIYPLLISSIEESWKIIGTDINEMSLELAYKQLELNPRLKGNIRLVDSVSKAEYPLCGKFGRENSNFRDNHGKEEFFPQSFRTLEGQDEILDFDASICNPPFYSSLEDLERSKNLKKIKPSPSSHSFQAKIHELVTEGGEFEFVKRIMFESCARKPKLRRFPWYTSMVGYKSTLTRLVTLIKERSIPISNYAISEIIIPSQKDSKYFTRRWLIGWTFSNIHLSHQLSHCTSSQLKHFNPSMTELVIPFKLKTVNKEETFISLSKADDILRNVIRTSLDFKNNESTCKCFFDYKPLKNDNKAGFTHIIVVDKDIWSRSYRRGMKQGSTTTTVSPSSSYPAAKSTESVLLPVVTPEKTNNRSINNRNDFISTKPKPPSPISTKVSEPILKKRKCDSSVNESRGGCNIDEKGAYPYKAASEPKDIDINSSIASTNSTKKINDDDSKILLLDTSSKMTSCGSQNAKLSCFYISISVVDSNSSSNSLKENNTFTSSSKGVKKMRHASFNNCNRKTNAVSQNNVSSEFLIKILWRYGPDSKLYESLCGLLKRKLAEV